MGEIDGVPLALHTVATSEAAGLLFHVRYPERTFASENPALPEGTALEEAVKNGRAEVTLDTKTGWLNIFDSENAVSTAEVRELLGEFFQCLAREGVDVKKRTCLKCGSQAVEKPGFENDRLQLVCEACQAEAELKFRRSTELNLANVPLLIIPGAMCAFLGALIWGGIWFSYHWVMEKFGEFYAPALLIAMIYCGTGWLVAKPVSAVISKVRNRGVHFGAMLALFCCAAGIFLGELVHVAALCMQVLNEIPPLEGVAYLWWALFQELPWFYFVGKAVATVSGLYFAYVLALPKRESV